MEGFPEYSPVLHGVNCVYGGFDAYGVDDDAPASFFIKSGNDFGNITASIVEGAVNFCMGAARMSAVSPSIVSTCGRSLVKGIDLPAGVGQGGNRSGYRTGSAADVTGLYAEFYE